jgi:hypothetical protein
LAFGNNPNYYIDPGGETLRVSYKDPKLKEQYICMVEKAFANKVTASINEEGIVNFHQRPNTLLDQYEQSAFKSLVDVEMNDATAQYELLYQNVDVPTGDYYGSRIDIADMEAHGNDNNFITSKSVLVHETVEQLEKAKMLQDPDHPDFEIANESEGFKYAHENAEVKDSQTSNIDRTQAVAGPKVLGSNAKGEPTETYTEFNVLQKQNDGSTVSGTYESFSENGVLKSQKFTPDSKNNKRDDELKIEKRID